MIGDCGLTLQKINGELLPEIGFHIRRDCQRMGFQRTGKRNCITNELDEIEMHLTGTFSQVTA